MTALRTAGRSQETEMRRRRHACVDRYMDTTVAMVTQEENPTDDDLSRLSVKIMHQKLTAF